MTFYLLAEHPMCLHKLFQHGYVKALIRQTTRDGVEFWIYRDKLTKDRRGKYWLGGRRSRINYRDEALLAIELAGKHQVKKVRI